MAQIKFNISSIKNFEEEVEKCIEKYLEDNFDVLMERYLSKNNLDIKSIQEKVNKKELKAIH